MISYETNVNKYYYDMNIVDEIINIVQNGRFYDSNYCTKEKITSLMEKINNFISSIKTVQEKEIVERKETEEEAREYFGEEFISELNSFLTELDKDKTMVAIHGTSPENCPSILEEGLRYKSPNLTSTAVQQHMNYGQKDMKYNKFADLLNWPHREYKGLVLIAVPYESFYKEGLWEHYQEGNSYSYDYRIPADFIAGYIDVENKKLIKNPKYTRDHDYSGLDHDMDIFKERKDLNNENIISEIIESEKSFSDMIGEPVRENESIEEEIDIEEMGYKIEELIGTFNSIKYGFPDKLNESRYESLLEELKYQLNMMKKSLPVLKTEEEVLQKKKELDDMFSNPSNKVDAVDPDFDFDWEDSTLWDDGEEWDTGEEINKFY